VIAAFACLRRTGFTVGAQLMIGLPGETTINVLAGARQLAELRPDLVRIYPALVIAGSGLARLYEQGEYKPLSLNKAVALCAGIKIIFANNGIRVVRMGLQPSAGLEKEVVAGPYHPAFGELVQSRILFQQIRQQLKGSQGKKELHLAAADESFFRGRNNMNRKRLEELGLLQGITVLFKRTQARNTIILK
jgi:histone acetyltransferase (RNA polymerase elongator complex component)